jgi:hypothetical protein
MSKLPERIEQLGLVIFHNENISCICVLFWPSIAVNKSELRKRWCFLIFREATLVGLHAFVIPRLYFINLFTAN